MIQVRCSLPTEIEFNKYFHVEYSKLWINVESVIEIDEDTIVENQDSKGKVIFSFEKK